MLRNDASEADVVRFYFPRTVSLGDAESQVAKAAAIAGVANRGVRENRAQGDSATRVIQLKTTLSRKSGFLTRRIDVAGLRRLDLFRRSQVFLSLPTPARIVSGPVVAVESASLGRRLRVEGDGTVTYRVPASFLLASLVIMLVLVGVPFGVLLPLSTRVERKPLDTAQKLRRLRRRRRWAVGVGVIATFIALFAELIYLPPLIVSEIAPSLSRSEWVSAVAFGVLFAALFAAQIGGAALATYPSYKRIRGIGQPVGAAASDVVRGAGLVLVPVGVVLVVIALLPSTIRSSRWLLPALLIGLVLAVSSPSFIMRAVRSYELDPATRDRLRTLCERQGLRVKDVRGYAGRASKSANAFLTGFARSRYVVVSDYVLDTFNRDEVDSVVCHEIAHGKQHHRAIRLGVVSVLLVLMEVPHMPYLRLVGFLGLFGSPLLLSPLSRALERRADDYAAQVTGFEPTIRALEHLATLNHAIRRPGPLARLFQRHPGIDERVKRLRGQACGTTSDAPPALF